MEKNTHDAREIDIKGIAGLFRKEELKKYFIRYLTLIGCLEIFIFFVCFLSQLEPFNMPFPWKEYFVAAFTIPIAITFVLGVIIIAFNTYYFKDSEESESLAAENTADGYGLPGIQNRFFRLKWQFQFLVVLFALGMGGVVFYKLDDIFRVIGYAGGKTGQVIAVILVILVTGAVLLGAVFLLLHYLLHRKRMEYAHEFKKEIMNRMGILLLDDNTLVNSEGKVIFTGNPGQKALPAVETSRAPLLAQVADGIKHIDIIK